MFAHRVVRSRRARWRRIYLVTILSRMLIVSMIHELSPATLFRFPACLMDLPPTRLDACERTPYFIGQLPVVPHLTYGQIA